MKRNEYKKQATVDKMNFILGVHRSSELREQYVPNCMFNIVQKICWLKYEYDSITRMKTNPQRRYVIRRIEEVVDILYERYDRLLCLK